MQAIIRQHFLVILDGFFERSIEIDVVQFPLCSQFGHGFTHGGELAVAHFHQRSHWSLGLAGRWGDEHDPARTGLGNEIEQTTIISDERIDRFRTVRRDGRSVAAEHDTGFDHFQMPLQPVLSFGGWAEIAAGLGVRRVPAPGEIAEAQIHVLIARGQFSLDERILSIALEKRIAQQDDHFPILQGHGTSQHRSRCQH